MFLLRAEALMEEHLNLNDCSCQEVSEVEIWARFILEEVSIPVVGSVGLVGNLAAIVVHSHPDMKNTFNQSLITLAVFEILFLVLVICDHATVIWSEVYIVMLPYFIFPLKNILLSCETYLLMSIALERLIAVVRPLWYRTARLRLSSWYHSLVFILPTLIISVSFNIPKFFELQLVSVNTTDSNNVTKEVWEFEVTPLRLDPNYIKYYIFWTRSLGTGLLPILFLLVTNSSIYLSLQRQRPTNTNTRNCSIATAVIESQERRPSVFSILSDWLGGETGGAGATEINTMLSEDQITENRRSLSHSARTLSAIVLLYVVCNLPRLLINLAEYIYQSQLYQDYSDCRCVKNIVWLEVFVRLNHFLLTVNSSVNFIIYWSVGKQFKSTLRGILTKVRFGSSINSNHVDV